MRKIIPAFVIIVVAMIIHFKMKSNAEKQTPPRDYKGYYERELRVLGDIENPSTAIYLQFINGFIEILKDSIDSDLRQRIEKSKDSLSDFITIELTKEKLSK